MSHLNELILSNLLLAIIWLAYELGFKRLRLFQANRIYLVGGTMLAILLPWLPINLELGMVNGPVFSLSPSEAGTLAVQPNQLPEVVTSAGGLSLSDWIVSVWIALVVIQLGVVIVSLLRLVWLARVGKVTRQGRIRIVSVPRNWSAFSLFRTIYYPGRFNPSDPDTRTIMEHEMVHICQWHTLDNILLLAVRILFFYNPAAHLLASRARLVHEYIADEVASSVDQANYSRILVGHHFMVPALILTHPFNKQSFLKQRLTMLVQKTHKRSAGWIYLLTIPVMAGMMFLSSWSASAQTQAKKSKEEIAKMAVEKELTKAGFSENDIEEIKNRIDGVTKVEISGHPDKMESLTSDGKETFYIVEAMPKFDGGNLETFRNWVQTKVKYPEIAKSNGIEGTVFVSFIVKDDGTLGDISILRSVDPSLDNEVIRVLKTSPAWEPGRQRGKKVNVSFSVPVKFNLGDKK